ncbi:MAG TPA: dethiobiotin synthase [Candidatus Manganitrophaceae bacterium]
MVLSSPKGIFIIGTDTGVGKTVIAGAIARFLVSQGVDVGVMKPIETGCRRRGGKLIPADGSYLRAAARVEDPLGLITPYPYQYPLAPWVASIREKRRIHFKKIRSAYEQLRRAHSFLIVEGVGGLLVPLTAKSDLLDLILFLELPVLLVARSGLGTINHTLLTIQYGSQQGLQFQGILLNRTTPQETLADKTNPETLRRRTGLPLLGCFPYFEKKGSREENIERSKSLFMKRRRREGRDFIAGLFWK